MNEQNLKIVLAYYDAISNKCPQLAAEYLAEEVQLTTPLAAISGKSTVVPALTGFSNAIEGIEIRAKFTKENQVMLAYNIIFPQPIGSLRAAGLFTIKNNLINNIELFYDSKQVETKRDEIFKKSK